MSSLQKFHRRTLVAAVKLVGSEAPIAGAGFYLGLAGDGTSYMYVAPKSTEVTGWQCIFGSTGLVRGTLSTTNGLANTNTLFGFGNTTASGHPAAYYCKTLTTGGYNTWYLPAKDELLTAYSNKSKTPFATANAFRASMYFSSTEYNGGYSWGQYMNDGRQTVDNFQGKRYGGGFTRAIRMSLV